MDPDEDPTVSILQLNTLGCLSRMQVANETLAESQGSCPYLTLYGPQLIEEASKHNHLRLFQTESEKREQHKWVENEEHPNISVLLYLTHCRFKGVGQ